MKTELTLSLTTNNTYEPVVILTRIHFLPFLRHEEIKRLTATELFDLVIDSHEQTEQLGKGEK